MSGLLGGILAAVGVVAAVATGGVLGIVAGALIAGSYAASQGWIKGSVGNFLNSGWGHGLVAAVGLGAAAYSALNAVTPPASTAATTPTAQASVAATAAGAPAGDAASGAASTLGPESQAAALPSDFSSSVGIPANYSTSLTGGDPSAVTPGLTPAAVAGAPSSTDPAYTAAQGSAQATAQDQAAVTPQATAATPSATAGAGTNQTPSQMAQTGPGGLQGPGAAAGATPPQSGVSGFLSSAGKALEAHPNLAMVGGQALSGLAQGMSQQKQLQEMIAAQQWGNEQWTDPQQLSQLQSAAAAPITVPSGYLQRAQAVSNLMSGKTSQTGPVTGVQPVQPAPGTPNPTVAPTPTVAPLGMGGTTAQSPVPLAAMGMQPRGGM